LGAAGESLGMDRQLRTSTAKRRVHSLIWCESCQGVSEGMGLAVVIVCLAERGAKGLQAINEEPRPSIACLGRVRIRPAGAQGRPRSCGERQGLASGLRRGGAPRLRDGASLWLKGLALITLYPVGSVGRTTILRAGGREARDGPDQSVPRDFDPREIGGHRSHPGRGGRPRRLARFWCPAQARFKTAPSGTRPVSR
jgi:hypothetical protein